MIVWGGYNRSVVLNDGGMYNAVANTWTATTATGLAGRYHHTAVWTGSEMIVWGGDDVGGVSTNTGGRYNPGGYWLDMTTNGAPLPRSAHSTVWTGSRMVVWGGYGGDLLNDGGWYDPAMDNWNATTTVGAPSGRWHHTAVWTGSRMLIWSGLVGGNAVVNDGGQWCTVSLYMKN